MPTRLLLAGLCALAALPAAHAQMGVASESRDAATAYIFTLNFVVGRTARDCFPLLGKTATPTSFESAWQQRNRVYMDAATAYIDRRLIEAEAQGGVAGRNRVAAALNAAVAKNGPGAVDNLLAKGDKQAACARVVGLMEDGKFDIDARFPMFGEVRALVAHMADAQTLDSTSSPKQNP